MLRLVLVLLLLTAGCAKPFPVRPEVAFYNAPEPPLIPQPPVTRPGQRRGIMPPPVPAPICMTDADHIALDAYLDQVAAWRGWRLK